MTNVVCFFRSVFTKLSIYPLAICNFNQIIIERFFITSSTVDIDWVGEQLSYNTISPADHLCLKILSVQHLTHFATLSTFNMRVLLHAFETANLYAVNGFNKTFTYRLERVDSLFGENG